MSKRDGAPGSFTPSVPMSSDSNGLGAAQQQSQPSSILSRTAVPGQAANLAQGRNSPSTLEELYKARLQSQASNQSTILSALGGARQGTQQPLSTLRSGGLGAASALTGSKEYLTNSPQPRSNVRQPGLLPGQYLIAGGGRSADLGKNDSSKPVSPKPTLSNQSLPTSVALQHIPLQSTQLQSRTNQQQFRLNQQQRSQADQMRQHQQGVAVLQRVLINSMTPEEKTRFIAADASERSKILSLRFQKLQQLKAGQVAEQRRLANPSSSTFSSSPGAERKVHTGLPDPNSRPNPDLTVRSRKEQESSVSFIKELEARLLRTSSQTQQPNTSITNKPSTISYSTPIGGEKLSNFVSGPSSTLSQLSSPNNSLQSSIGTSSPLFQRSALFSGSSNPSLLMNQNRGAEIASDDSKKKKKKKKKFDTDSSDDDSKKGKKKKDKQEKELREDRKKRKRKKEKDRDRDKKKKKKKKHREEKDRLIRSELFRALTGSTNPVQLAIQHSDNQSRKKAEVKDGIARKRKASEAKLEVEDERRKRRFAEECFIADRQRVLKPDLSAFESLDDAVFRLYPYYLLDQPESSCRVLESNEWQLQSFQICERFAALKERVHKLCTNFSTDHAASSAAVEWAEICRLDLLKVEESGK